MRLAELESARVAVWGAGREGHAALTAISRRFSGKLLTWIVTAAEREDCQRSAPEETCVAVEGKVELSDFDIIVKSPGISLYRPDIEAARLRSTRFTSGTAIWFAEHPQVRTICVTGTKGKSSTAAMIAHLLRAAGVRTALAGNIGLPLLALEDGGTPAQWYVIELSSFQTADLDIAPDVAVLTSLVEEHLDWHGDGGRYRRDKLRLFHRAARCVWPSEWQQAVDISGEIKRFSATSGWHVEDGAIRFGTVPVVVLDHLPVRGLHNAINACAALTALDAAGFRAIELAPQVRTFRPLPHRLQELGRRAGVLYVNDSIATTPAAMLAARDCYPGSDVVLIVGGLDRGLDWQDAVGHLKASLPRLICTQGENGPRVAEWLRATGVPVCECADLASAVSLASKAAAGAGVVLLSPGAPSFPVFRDYTERGRVFAGAAGFDPSTIGSIEGMGIA